MPSAVMVAAVANLSDELASMRVSSKCLLRCAALVATDNDDEERIQKKVSSGKGGTRPW